jgi:ketosteroid isomerase-like protein
VAEPAPAFPGLDNLSTKEIPMVDRSWKRAWVAALALAALPALPASAGEAALKSLVAAERAFAAMSLEQGIKPSFLKFLAPDGIVFRPTATNGRKAIGAQSPSVARLSWEPAYAEVSAAGDLGYTTGPWELHLPAERKQPPAYGHFISVWKKPPGGPWRVALDIGISHPQPPSGGVGSGAFAPGPAHTAAGPAASAMDLKALDRATSHAAHTHGMAVAFASHAAEDVRFNTEGAFPFVGLEIVRAQFARAPGVFNFLPQGAGMAASHDLGYTYGIAQRFDPGATVAADTSVYLHVWRADSKGTWRIALSVMNPLPAPGTQ